MLDEADRILDMGFKDQLDSILQYLPPCRQTLLFSATQTKSVKDLARLSLKSPEYLAVHADDAVATPAKLHQHYITCNLHEKLDVLFSFLKSHLKSKIIVFMSTCAQVRFVYECFRSMQPGIPLIALHGKIKQEKRTIVFLDFNRRKSAVLFATDIAARGLDFPEVDWVFQLDAPEDTAMYIHRAGRTARYQSGGRALMLLMPTEEKPVVDKLETVGINLKKLSVNKKQYISVASQAASLLVSHPEYRLLAKKAFIGYLRSLQNLPSTGHQSQPVDLLKLPVDLFSQSLGMAFTPPIPVAPVKTSEQGKEKTKNVNRGLDKLKKQIQLSKERRKARAAAGRIESEDSSDDSDSEKMTEAEKLIKTHGKKKARMLLTNRSLRPVSQMNSVDQGADDSEEEDLLVTKQVHNEFSDEFDTNQISVTDNKNEISSRAMKRKLSKIRPGGESAAVDSNKSKRIKFTEDGSAVDMYGQMGGQETELVESRALKDRVQSHMASVKSKIDAVRRDDELKDRERIKEKHKMKKRLQKDENKEESGAEYGAVLSNACEEADSYIQSGHFSEGDSSSHSSSDELEKGKPSSDTRQKGRKARAFDAEEYDISIAEQEKLALKLLNS